MYRRLLGSFIQRLRITRLFSLYNSTKSVHGSFFVPRPYEPTTDLTFSAPLLLMLFVVNVKGCPFNLIIVTRPPTGRKLFTCWLTILIFLGIINAMVSFLPSGMISFLIPRTRGCPCNIPKNNFKCLYAQPLSLGLGFACLMVAILAMS